MKNTRAPRLTDNELQAALEALGERLAGELDYFDDDDSTEPYQNYAVYEAAHARIRALLDHRERIASSKRKSVR